MYTHIDHFHEMETPKRGTSKWWLRACYGLQAATKRVLTNLHILLKQFNILVVPIFLNFFFHFIPL